MASKSLPKPASKATLNKKFKVLAIETNGRLDITTEKGRENIDLLQKYYNAFSNLYGAILLSDAWKLFKLAEKDITSKRHIVKKDFLAYSEVARYEEHDYFVLEMDELYEEEERGTAANRFILNKKLHSKGYARFAEYYRLSYEQFKHPICVLDREELLSWAQPNTLWLSIEGRALKSFIENLTVDSESENVDVNGAKIAGKTLRDFIFWSKSDIYYHNYLTRAWEKKAFEEYHNVVESEIILRSIEQYINIQASHIKLPEEIEYLLKDMEEVGVSIEKQELETFLRLFTDFCNNSRQWVLSGWKPVELHVPNNSEAKPAISFGKNMQKSFADGSLNKEEVMEAIKKLGFDVIE